MDMTGSTDPRSRGGRRAAHIAWAAVAIIASLVMVFGKQSGHPPLMVFVPVVWIFWAVGHAVIWTIQRLAAKGRRAATETGGGHRPWPPTLRIAVIGTGTLALIGLLQVVMTVLQRKRYPSPDATVWNVTLAVCFVHGVCFAGLLLRQRWSRLLSAVLAAGWALLLASQIAEHLRPGVPSDTGELLMACLLMVLLLLLGLHLVGSRNVEKFLTH